MRRPRATLAPRALKARTQVLLFLLSAVVLVGAWEAAVASGVNRFVLPPPGDVIKALWDFRGPLFDEALVTLTEIGLAFGLATLAGVLLGAAITYSDTLASLLYPPLLMVHAIPKLAIAPLLLIWFGFGLASKVAVAFLIAFFPVVIESAAGFKSVDPALYDLARSLGASRVRRFLKIDLPHALPSIFAGLKIAITLAVSGAIVGEFISSDRGLGFLLQSAVSQHLIELSFAAVIVIALLSIGLFGLVALVERLAVPWARTKGG